MKRIILVLLIPAAFLLGVRSGRYSRKGVESGQAVVDRDYYGETLSLIADAQSSIHLLMFELFRYPGYPESKTNRLLDELADARKRGVEVRICVEGGEEYLGDDFLEKQRAGVDYLLQNGIDVRMDSEGRTSHAKLLLVDGRWLLLGSTNWTHHAMERNAETNILIESPALVSSFEQYFSRMWKDSSPLEREEPRVSEVGESSAIALLLNAPREWDGKKVEIAGEVEDLERRRSKKGNLYSTFYLVDDGGRRVKIFTWGHPEVVEGDDVSVFGIFRETKRVGGLEFHNEVEAERMARK